MNTIDYKQFEGHTPGPWKAETVYGTWHNLVYCRIVSDNFEHPGGMAYAALPLKGKTKKQNELAGLYKSQGEQLAQKNALLIAAAPDLLKENQSLKLEIQKQKEEIQRFELERTEMYHKYEKQKELNAELVRSLTSIQEKWASGDHSWSGSNDLAESLIKKSSEI